MMKEQELLLFNVFSILSIWMQPPNFTKKIIIGTASLLSYWSFCKAASWAFLVKVFYFKIYLQTLTPGRPGKMQITSCRFKIPFKEKSRAQFVFLRQRRGVDRRKEEILTLLWREKKIFQSFVDTIASALVICPFLLGHGWTKGIAAMCRFIKKQCKEKKTANKKKKKNVVLPIPLGFHSYIFRSINGFWIFGLLFSFFISLLLMLLKKKKSTEFIALMVRQYSKFFSFLL